MAESGKGGSGLGDLITAGIGVGLGLLVLGALVDSADDRKKKQGLLPPPKYPNYDDADFVEIESYSPETKLAEKLESLEPLRQSDLAAWFREIAKDPKLTELVKQRLQREQELQSIHEQAKGKPRTDTRDQKPREAWYETMHAEIEKVKQLFRDAGDQEPIIEAIRRRYMEGEA